MQLPVITDRILQALPPVYLRDDTVESYDSAVIGQHFLHFKNTLRERNYSNLNMKNLKQNLVNEIIDLIFRIIFFESSILLTCPVFSPKVCQSINLFSCSCAIRAFYWGILQAEFLWNIASLSTLLRIIANVLEKPRRVGVVLRWEHWTLSGYNFKR